MTTPSQPTELDKAVALHIIQRLRAKHLILERFQEEEIKEVVEAELSVATKRAQELEKERDDYKRDSMLQIGIGNQRINQIEELEQQLSKLRIEYKKALKGLNDEISSLVCAFVISQHLPACDSYNNPYENWCGICKRRTKVALILSTPFAIETMKEKKV